MDFKDNGFAYGFLENICFSMVILIAGLQAVPLGSI